MTAQPLETVVLPRVSGRHRDQALASARKCRAIQLKLQGLTYQQIADELGYTSRGTVYKIIKTAQAAQLTGAVEEHLDIEVSRLNALQAGTEGVRPGDVVTTVVTGAAPHYLLAEGPLLGQRRTAAGGAWAAGRSPITPGVLLGMPRVGAGS